MSENPSTLFAGPRDLLGRRWAQVAWLGALAAFLVGSVFPEMRSALWISGFGLAGTLCVVNTVRCRRLHCAFTGPIFLTGAVLSAVKGTHGLGLGWSSIGLGVVGLAAIPVAIELCTGKLTLGKRCC